MICATRVDAIVPLLRAMTRSTAVWFLMAVEPVVFNSKYKETERMRPRKTSKQLKVLPAKPYDESAVKCGRKVSAPEVYLLPSTHVCRLRCTRRWMLVSWAQSFGFVMQIFWRSAAEK